MSDQHQFTVSLIVKGATREKAQAELERRLNEWFCEDYSRPQIGTGYPEGSLLLWTLREDVAELARTGDAADAQGDEFEPR